MANQVAARLSGDDYQHLYAWQFVLELLMPKKQVLYVTIEDAYAGSVDDVTIQYEPGPLRTDKFFQVKYHVDQRSEYSSQFFIDHKSNESSLLQKFWSSWKRLREQNPQRQVELHLVSNWTWDTKDKLKGCFDGHDNSIKQDFLTASPRSDLGKIRKLWQSHLGASDADFYIFIKSLRFRLGFDCGDELEKRVAERMENLRLKSNRGALLVAVGIVRGWIKNGIQALAKKDIESVLENYDLYLPKNDDQGVTVYLTTVKAQKFDLPPDHIIDWRDRFVGDANKKSHQLNEPSDWNAILLPELRNLETRINEETDSRLIRARGLARLSAWFAFGFCFSDVARYTIEVDQNGALWRSDASASDDFSILTNSQDGSFDGEILDGEGETVALGISVTGPLDDDVRNFLANRDEKVAALLLLRPERELGRGCLRNQCDAMALTNKVKDAVRHFVKRWRANKLLLFYFGPLSGACFLGHRLNAVCQQIQIMEDQQPGYAPSFILI